MYKSCSRTQHSTQSSRSQPLSLSLYKLFSLKASSEDKIYIFQGPFLP
uniref:Uncharacterized protein n=1 Tax=Vitis vinifera TaxID=29760 RepID=F6HMD6_VITVI